MIKSSPLSGIYKNYPIKMSEVSGWQIADNFGDEENELKHLKNESVIADWSHVGKISLSNGNADLVAENIFVGASKLKPLNSLTDSDKAVLRLTMNDYLILCKPGMEDSLQTKIDKKITTSINQTGAQGCLVLGGPRRDEVLQRSTAVDLRRDKIIPGSVLQSSIHTINMTLYRTKNFEIIVHPRNLSESLFSSIMDVGIGVGLIPTGISTVPVSFEETK